MLFFGLTARNNYTETVKRRVIIRSIVSADTPKKLAETVEKFGSTNASVQSRVIAWLSAQSEEIKTEILGHYPGGMRADLPKRIVKAMGDRA
jgi:hypothetical protein